MIPGIGSMGGGAELLILLVSLLILLFGTNRQPALGRSFEIGMRELRKEAARLGDEDEANQRPRNKEDGRELAPNAGKGEGSV
jgi:Sec-independent protein translocase protein TatA